ANVGTGKAVSVAGISISGADAGDYHLANGTASTTADITAKALAVTDAVANSKVYDGSDAATIDWSSAGLSGIVSGDSVSLDHSGYSAHFDDKNVASHKPVTVAGVILGGGDSGNYTVAQPSGLTADITAKQLSVSFHADDKVYDGGAAAAIKASPAPELVGVVSGDSVALDGGSAGAVFADRNVGTAKTVTASGFTKSGTDADNYVFASPQGTTTADIGAKHLTISGATANDKTYDGNATATIDWSGAGLNGVVSGDDVTIDHSGSTAGFGDKNVGTAKPVSVSGVGLGGDDASNYSVGQPSGLSADIGARGLTVTAAGQNKVYDGTADATVSLSSDKLAADTLTLGYTGASFDDKNVGTGKAVGVSGISISGADAGNYHLTGTTASTTADIAARAIRVTAKSDSKVYDGDNSSSKTPDVTSGSIAAGDTAHFSQHFDDKNVATGKTMTATGSVADGNSGTNYDVTFVDDTTGAISARGLTVSAHGVSKIYDGTRDATVTLSSDKVGGDALTPSYASASFADRNVGSGKAVSVSGITISGADAGNYVLLNATDSTTADITARDLTVTAHGVNKVYDGTTVATVTLSSDKLSSDAVTLDYAAAAFGNKNVGTGKAVTASGISTSGADAGNYHLTGTTAGTTADITARGLTVSATGVNKVYDGTVGATVGLSSDKVAFDSLTLGYGSAAFGDRNVGTAKPVGVSGISVSGADAGNYSLLNTTASTTANITARPITVTAVADSKTYDGTTGSNATPTVPSGSIAVNDVSDFSETFATKTVGSGKTLVPAGSVLDHNGGGNYAVTFMSSTTGVIVPKTLLVTGITAASKPWDGSTTATLDTSGATLNGVVSPDAVTLGLGGASGAFSSSAVGTWTVQIAGLTLSGADSGNYNLMQPTATASVAAWNASGKGFYAPVGVASSLFVPAPAALPTANASTVWNTVKGGQTVPLKFNVYAGAVERTALTDIASFTQASVACTGGDGTDPVDITTTGNTSLRYDTTAMQWIQNWKTPSYNASASCYRATVRFADGSALSAFFKLTK
ncbi:MAG TPA: YDG domain-containing protein, partial [Gaiellaceae bacterium]